MNKKILIMIVIVSLVISGCNVFTQDSDNDKKPQLQMGELSYEMINTYSKEEITADLEKWYEDNFKQEGLSSLNTENHTYLLFSTGEKPNSGYGIESLRLIGTEKEIEVYVELRVPSQGEMTAQVITYPNILIKIDRDSREFVLEEIKEIPAEKDLVKNDTGMYVGLIDNHSIEIKISGVPDEHSAKAFELTDKVKENFDNLGLNTGDQVHFTFYENNNGQRMLTSIEKIDNDK
ncbi:MAG: hypothetical protein CVU87_11195 [Firmicutes bacterium HGW-Firmicutes-12]|nr:MAG: hypothetical protein CVU87_11195 [Firmicutes bacterium HGW-Firmicutes-12]